MTVSAQQWHRLKVSVFCLTILVGTEAHRASKMDLACLSIFRYSIHTDTLTYSKGPFDSSFCFPNLELVNYQRENAVSTACQRHTRPKPWRAGIPECVHTPEPGQKLQWIYLGTTHSLPLLAISLHTVSNCLFKHLACSCLASAQGPTQVIQRDEMSAPACAFSKPQQLAKTTPTLQRETIVFVDQVSSSVRRPLDNRLL